MCRNGPSNLSDKLCLHDVVIFDLGQVLIEVRVDRAFRGISRATGLSVPEVGLRLARAHPLYHGFETGEVGFEEVRKGVCSLLGSEISPDVFTSIWNAVLGDEITSTVDLVRLIGRQQRVRVAVLSNTNATHVAHMRKTWPFLKELEHVYMSNEIGLRKPDAGAFLHVLTELGVRPDRAVFVDDREENVHAAEQLGMIGIVASSPEVVESRLVELGLVDVSTEA